MKVLIIDDEAPLRKGLIQQLNALCPQVKQIAEADGVVSGIKMINEFHPDVVFLDVEMNDGTGMDLLAQIGNPSFQLIFVTAHAKYAVDAFKFSAIDYLLKPVDGEELVASILKSEKNIRTQDLSKQIEVLRQVINPSKNEPVKIVLKDSESIYYIQVSDIIRCEANGTYTHFYITGNETVIVSKNIKEYEDLLTPHDFVRVHNSHLVNLKKVKRFDKSEGGYLILENNEKIPVSQRKKDFVLGKLSRG